MNVLEENDEYENRGGQDQTHLICRSRKYKETIHKKIKQGIWTEEKEEKAEYEDAGVKNQTHTVHLITSCKKSTQVTWTAYLPAPGCSSCAKWQVYPVAILTGVQGSSGGMGEKQEGVVEMVVW